MIYFTADLHFGHENIISLCERPYANVEEMNEQLVKNINSVVTPEDTLYILGDLAFRTTTEVCNHYVSLLNGKKVLIKGNHDHEFDESLFESVHRYLELEYGKKRFVLFHYPMISWNFMRSGSYHLHGHIHSIPKYNIGNKNTGIYRYDVGVDANNWMPVSIEDIIEYFKDVPCSTDYLY